MGPNFVSIKELLILDFGHCIICCQPWSFVRPAGLHKIVSVSASNLISSIFSISVPGYAAKVCCNCIMQNRDMSIAENHGRYMLTSNEFFPQVEAFKDDQIRGI